MNSLTIAILIAVIAYASAQCTKTTLQQVSGATCDSITSFCSPELYCSSGTCKFYPVTGSKCSTDSDCNTSPYQSLFCNSFSLCARNKKNAGEVCAQNAECASNNCNLLTCAAMSVGSACTTANGCGSPTYSLFCNSTTNGFCQNAALIGSACGTINGQTIQCVPGSVCVNASATALAATSGVCTALSTEGQTCAISTINSNVAVASFCTSSSKVLQCINSKCTSPGGSGTSCSSNLNCDTSSTSCSNGVCTTYGSIACANSTQCGNGFCSCPDTTKAGQCLTPVTSSCTLKYQQQTECIATANSQVPLTYCLNAIKAARCCARNQNGYVTNTDLTLTFCSISTSASVSIVLLAVVLLFNLFM